MRAPPLFVRSDVFSLRDDDDVLLFASYIDDVDVLLFESSSPSFPFAPVPIDCCVPRPGRSGPD